MRGGGLDLLHEERLLTLQHRRGPLWQYLWSTDRGLAAKGTGSRLDDIVGRGWHCLFLAIRPFLRSQLIHTPAIGKSVAGNESAPHCCRIDPSAKTSTSYP